MNLSGNTIFITGGGSGIGRALAEALHKLGNQVIISGRRKGHLAETVAANFGMASIELDIQNPESIEAAAELLVFQYPELNVLINNAGIMLIDDVSAPINDEDATAIITTNLLGPIRMTSALIEHLKTKETAAVINVSSGLGFVPMSMTAVYSATKAAIHSYSMSLRFKLKDTSIKVLEIIPPWVQTDLLNSKNEPRAMPLDEFIAETIQALESGADEVMVERVKMLRNNAGPNEAAFFEEFNRLLTSGH